MNASQRLLRKPRRTRRAMWARHASKGCFAAVLLFVGIPAGALAEQSLQSEQGQMRDAVPRLVLGEPVQSGRDQVTVPVHFSPAEGERVGQIRAEIIVPEGPWRFRKVEGSKGSSLKASARQQREESTDSQGNKHRVSVILLSLSAGRNAMGSGQIAQLYFSLERPDVPISIPLAIRSFQTMPPEPETARDEPILEPPPADPPINPAPTCFFFAH